MDNKLYQQLLEAVAELEYSEDDAAPVVKKLKTSTQVCPRPNCGKIITDNLVYHVHYDKPYPHWRSNCKQCLCYLNPYTQEPLQGNKSQTQNTVSSLVRQHYKKLRQDQGLELAEEIIAKNRLDTAVIREQDTHTEIVIEDGNATITEYIYHRNK